ncbi:MAG TPA: exo-alpha-sialidase [Caulobacteraceae bacterium]|nr:exo-alpha-sialidase [Caulobacteraceae bacterium]
MKNPKASRRAAAASSALGAALLCAALAGPTHGAEIDRAVLPAPPGLNHGAAIAELRSGALLVCWYSGRHEEDRSVRILCSRGAGDGSAWSAPWTAVAPGEQAIGATAPSKSLGNVTLTALPDGRIWMIYGVIQSRLWPLIGEVCRNWACARIDARVSADEGRTWAPAHRLVDIGGALPRAELRPFDGGWLGPFYEENQQRVLIADIAFDGPRARVRAYWPLDGWKLIQPSLVAQRDGRFRAYFRDQRRRGVYTARFDARRGVWTGVSRTNLPNPGAAVDAFGDGAGRYVLVYNPSAKHRDRLALARSADGAYFAPGCDLATPADGGGAYPSVIRGHDGAWRVVYSSGHKSEIRFVRFTSRWLDECFDRKG